MEAIYVGESDLTFNDNNYLWRYLDLFKFISFLDTKSVYFSRLDTFNDPLEGVSFQGHLLRTFVKATPRTSEELNPLFSDQQKSQIISKRKADIEMVISDREKVQKTHYVSCWFLGESESLAMWDLYSSKNGVAIRIKPDKLINEIITQFSASQFMGVGLYGTCEYLALAKYSPYPIEEKKHIINRNKYVVFKKDKSYSHEQEFRFAISVPYENIDINKFGIPFSVANTITDFEVITHPLMDKWQQEIINNIVRDRVANIKVNGSELPLKGLF